jgi:hypothetical protein
VQDVDVERRRLTADLEGDRPRRQRRRVGDQGEHGVAGTGDGDLDDALVDALVVRRDDLPGDHDIGLEQLVEEVGDEAKGLERAERADRAGARCGEGEDQAARHQQARDDVGQRHLAPQRDPHDEEVGEVGQSPHHRLAPMTVVAVAASSPRTAAT